MINCKEQSRWEELAVAYFKTLLRKGHEKLNRFNTGFQHVKLSNMKKRYHRQAHTKNLCAYKLRFHKIHPGL
jgi:hypothetical protein